MGLFVKATGKLCHTWSMSVRNWYENFDDEDGRLGGFSMEWLRSTELIQRVLPAPPARVADIAGGPGRYSAWLAGLGYQVDLLDLVPDHVEQARRRASAQGVAVECVVGDARALPWADETFDVVLLMGALYHLQDRADRLACLAEARRVLKPGGALVTSHVTRWDSLFDWYRFDSGADAEFRHIVDVDLATGCHENPSNNPNWFTTAYFHTPDEIRDEVTSSGLIDVQVLAVEGFTHLIEPPEGSRKGDGLKTLLADLRTIEAEPALLGMSAHLMSLSRKAPVVIRKITVAEVPEMRAVQARSWLATYPNPEHGVSLEWVQETTNQFSSAESLSEWAEIVKTAETDPGQFSRVAEVDSRIVGLLHAETQADGTIELKAIYVDPPWVSKGVGTALMQAFDEWAGETPVRLDVAVYNQRAIDFYRRHGFESVAGSERIELDVIPVIDMIRPRRRKFE